jgi:hypothetical protein
MPGPVAPGAVLGSPVGDAAGGTGRGSIDLTTGADALLTLTASTLIAPAPVCIMITTAIDPNSAAPPMIAAYSGHTARRRWGVP